MSPWCFPDTTGSICWPLNNPNNQTPTDVLRPRPLPQRVADKGITGWKQGPGPRGRAGPQPRAGWSSVGPPASSPAWHGAFRAHPSHSGHGSSSPQPCLHPENPGPSPSSQHPTAHRLKGPAGGTAPAALSAGQSPTVSWDIMRMLKSYCKRHRISPANVIYLTRMGKWPLPPQPWRPEGRSSDPGSGTRAPLHPSPPRARQ